MTSRYRKEIRTIVEAPELTDADVLSMTEAAEMLGMNTIHSVHNAMARGRLTTVYDYGSRTAFQRPRRLVLRAEVEELRREMEQEGFVLDD